MNQTFMKFTDAAISIWSAAVAMAAWRRGWKICAACWAVCVLLNVVDYAKRECAKL